MFKFLKRFIFFVIFCYLVFFIFSRGPVYEKKDLRYGVTFSLKQARDLGLDWRKVYQDMFTDLGVKKVRLVAYWDELEPESGRYEWSDLDWQLDQAAQNKAEVILTVGGRVPRWPECHFPSWVKNESAAKQQENTLFYIEKVLARYKDREEIVAWQVENEPFLKYFGECPPLDVNFLDKEIALVKRLDHRPVVITDSGELSLWVPAAKRADIFGTTMYRDTYSKQFKRYIHYPITPNFFKFKKNITRLFASPQKWVVIEMQAEPWGAKAYQYISREERAQTMNPEKFRDMVAFAHEAGFGEFYLWGVEWWYWERDKQDNGRMLEEAKKIFNP